MTAKFGKFQLVGAAVALLLTSTMVLRVSSAAFTDTTENPGNSWAAGTVTLSDNRNGAAMYSMSNMEPGSTETKCIEVTYSGAITPSGAVTVHGTVSSTAGGSDGDGLANDTNLVVRVGAAGASCTTIGTPTQIYSGLLSGFNTSASPLSTGWTPGTSTDTMRPFEFTTTLDSNAPNNAQGDSAGATFTWNVNS